MGDENPMAGSFYFFTVMTQEYVLLMQKMYMGATIKDSLEDFGIVCTEMPFAPFTETKKIPTRDWPEEDGEDVYVPSRLPRNAYDMEIGLCYKGGSKSAYDGIKKFIDYLTGEDGETPVLKIYSPFTGIGRENVYLKEYDDDAFFFNEEEDVVLFSMTFRVTDPKTDIKPVYGSGEQENDIVDLTE